MSGRLTLATTHQLLRFHQGFDLVIIDELDAFPYHNDPMLAYAAEQACKVDGSFIYLSATPPQEMQRLVRLGKLPHARVPVRFHGHPLPIPQHLSIPSVLTCLKRGSLPRSLIQNLQKSLERKAQIFLFVSRIAHIEGLLILLRRSFPGVVIEGTSSKDSFRAEKVTAFRNRIISLLVTTTILERELPCHAVTYLFWMQTVVFLTKPLWYRWQDVLVVLKMILMAMLYLPPLSGADPSVERLLRFVL